MHKLSRRTFLKAAGVAIAAPMTAVPAAAEKPARPNIILILADDMGFSDAECYGGEVRTPNLAALASNGLRFTRHYSTGRCWPSRAAILTGYYAQHIRRDTFPGGPGIGDRPAWAPLLPRLLKPLGYRCYHSGKWHIDGTPQQGGFDLSWGRERVDCDWDRYFASKPLPDGAPPSTIDPAGYYSTIAIADHAINCQRSHAADHADAPFFQYIAFYSPHFPLQAIASDIETYRDAYIQGWDAVRASRLERMKRLGIVNCDLSAHQTDTIPTWNLSEDKLKQRIGPGEAGRAVAWHSLTEAQKRFQADKMAIHAAMITRMDAEIGRIVAELRASGRLDNTIIFFASDNGASAEQIIRGDGHDPSAPVGSADSYLCLGPGFATAANTPFKLHKHWNHEGGISSPLIVHWPAGIKDKGALRHTPSHFIDFLPTAVQLAGGKLTDQKDPPQRPGKSLVPILEKDQDLARDCLWWSHANNRAITAGDWKLVSKNARANEWELYNLKNDRCEMKDLAASNPEKVQQLSTKWREIADQFRHDAQKQS